MNRSGELRELFKRSLISKRKMESHRSVNSYPPIYNFSGRVHSFPSISKDIRIYFYEWSNLLRAPRTFTQIDSFDSFLKMCDMNLEFYQKEIIKNLGTVYITCYTGTKELSIRSTYRSLSESLGEYDSKQLISSIKPPSLVYENNNRLPENDGTFFG